MTALAQPSVWFEDFPLTPVPRPRTSNNQRFGRSMPDRPIDCEPMTNIDTADGLNFEVSEEQHLFRQTIRELVDNEPIGSDVTE